MKPDLDIFTSDQHKIPNENNADYTFRNPLYRILVKKPKISEEEKNSSKFKGKNRQMLEEQF